MNYIYYKLSTDDLAELDGPYFASSFAEMESASGLIADHHAQGERFLHDGTLAYNHFDFDRAPFKLPKRIRENFVGIACLGWVVLYCPAKELREEPVTS